jgi:hypothetical protein
VNGDENEDRNKHMSIDLVLVDTGIGTLKPSFGSEGYVSAASII